MTDTGAGRAAKAAEAAAEAAGTPADRPFPPGEYEVVVVGSGPGALQTAYFLPGRLAYFAAFPARSLRRRLRREGAS